jgi:hypothetical protein
MKVKEKEFVIPELDKLPDKKERAWSGEQLEILWKYRHKDLNLVAKHIGKTSDAVKCKLYALKRERGEQ